MNFTQNEFILLINAYYQAHAYSKGLKASGMFGEIIIQPEFGQFRELISQTTDTLINLIKEAEQKGQKGEVDKVIIKMKLTEIYKIPEPFLLEIENSINRLEASNGDMTAYRINFQMGSDYIYQFVGETMKNFGDHVNKKEGINSIIDSILNQNYWEGKELNQQISFIRNLKDQLNYSENWLKEYAYKMFVI